MGISALQLGISNYNLRAFQPIQKLGLKFRNKETDLQFGTFFLRVGIIGHLLDLRFGGFAESSLSLFTE